MAISKEKKLNDIEKITENTKVKVWVDIINKLLDDGADKEYIFKAYSVKGQDSYNFGNVVGMPNDFVFEDGNYIVTYGGIILQPDDYSLSGKILRFTNGAPTESDYLITVRYEGKKDEVIYEVKAS